MPEALTQDDTRQLEAMLREERKLLVGALSDRLHQGDDPDEIGLGNNMLAGGVDDRASGSLLNDEEIAELGLDLRELRAVESALERIERGTYGVCVNCSSPIGSARMHAQPTAALCITCQTEAERRPGSYAEGSSRMRL